MKNLNKERSPPTNKKAPIFNKCLVINMCSFTSGNYIFYNEKFY